MLRTHIYRKMDFMKANYKFYDFKESLDRMKEILSSSDSQFEEKDSIPSSDSLTFTNGFYVNCSALACDIRESSELAKKYNRPKLSKLLKTFISEMVAVMNGSTNCKEVLIEGDCVWAIYDTPYLTDINEVFSIAAKVNSAVKFLNYQLKKYQFEEVNVGIGISYGRSLMIKAGYKGSGINELVWLGNVVNDAHYFCSLGSKLTGWQRNKPIYVSSVFYSNLNDHNKGLLAYDSSTTSYYGNVVNTEMDEYLQKLS